MGVVPVRRAELSARRTGIARSRCWSRWTASLAQTRTPHQSPVARRRSQ